MPCQSIILNIQVRRRSAPDGFRDHAHPFARGFVFPGTPYAPARKMIEAGLPIARHPISIPGVPLREHETHHVPWLHTARMLPEEVLHAVTLNTAYAMGLQETHGISARGKKQIDHYQRCSGTGLPSLCVWE